MGSWNKGIIRTPEQRKRMSESTRKFFESEKGIEFKRRTSERMNEWCASPEYKKIMKQYSLAFKKW